MAVPSLNLEEYQFGDAGVLLNGTSAVPFCDLTSIEGLDNAPFATSITDQDGRDGGYVEAQYETTRTVTLGGIVYANPSLLETYLDSLKYNFRPLNVNTPLYFNHGTGQIRCVFGKSLGFKASKDQMRRLGKAEFQVQIACEDPRIYDSTVTTVTIPVAGTGTATLIGNRRAPAIMRLNGPLTNPAITYLDLELWTNITMTFNTTLIAGQYIDIDLVLRTCLRETGASVRHLMTFTGGTWVGNELVTHPVTWYLLNGGSSTLSLEASAGTGNLVITTRSAWR